MKILMLSNYFYPRIGGVEKVVSKLCDYLPDHEVSIITEKYDKNLPDVSAYNKWTKIFRMNYTHKKYVGLLSIWFWLFKHRRLISQSEIVHIHDVFIWYLPFRLLFPFKPVYITYHGWEGTYPVPVKSLIQKKLAFILCNKCIVVGKYLEKYNKIKANLVSYNGVDIPKRLATKKRNSVIYVGRLDKNTGLEIILQALDSLPELSVDFYGDGELRNECAKYGKVHGFVKNPQKYLSTAEYCLTGGYLTSFEAFANKSQVFICYQNKLRQDTFSMTPFREYITLTSSSDQLSKKLKYFMKNRRQSNEIVEKAFNWVRNYSWQNAADEYKKIWSIKE